MGQSKTDTAVKAGFVREHEVCSGHRNQVLAEKAIICIADFCIIWKVEQIVNCCCHKSIILGVKETLCSIKYCRGGFTNTSSKVGKHHDKACLALQNVCVREFLLI